MASRRNQRRHTCGSKRRYETEAQAKSALAGMLRQRPSPDWWMAVYRCRFCGVFHYGHAPRNKRG